MKANPMDLWLREHRIYHGDVLSVQMYAGNQINVPVCVTEVAP